ncbi:MAG: aminotransferase class V-fold PLP-dependent enzyme [Anaerolineae bacterium]
MHLEELFLLCPDMTFLNHGSFGACPRPVFEAYQAWQRQLEAQPVEFLGRRFNGLMAQARARLAAYVGAGADDLVFVPNATTGINIVARSLALAPGDEVLATDHEYGAMDRTWRLLCRKQGAIYRNAPITLPTTTPEAMIAQLWAGVTPRTRIIFLSHITSPTALTWPVKDICQRARAAGILTVVDGAHAPGQIALDLAGLGADFYTGNCHKWLCAPKGAGFLFGRPEVQHLIEPLVVSWGWESETPGPSPFVDYLEWTGTQDIAAYLAVPAAIDFQATHDWEQMRLACHELVREARQRINGLTGLASICPDAPEWFQQMAAIRLPACDTAALKARLWDEWRVEAPIITWNGEPFVRVSVQAYNDQADIERLVAALTVLLPVVQAPAPNG